MKYHAAASQPVPPRFRALLLTLILLVPSVCGCAAKSVGGPEARPMFPAMPDPPRLQFLTSYSKASDVVPQGALKRLVVGEDPRLIDRPHGMVVHDGQFYLVDRKLPGYVIIDPQAQTFRQVARPEQLSMPITIAVDDDGTRYVADATSRRVMVFDHQDRPVRVIQATGEFRPGGLCIDGDRLIVGNTAGHNLCVFDKKSGRLLETFGDDDKVMWPQGLSLGPDRTLLVVDTGNGQTLRFTPDGALLDRTGAFGDGGGSFARPKDGAIDRAGRFYVVDVAFSNVQLFDAEGRLLMYFGGPGGKPGNLNMPIAVAVDYETVDYYQQFADPGFELEYVVAVVSQFGTKLNIYGFGRMDGVAYDDDGAALAAAAP